VSGAIVDTADGPIIFDISREIASHKRMEEEVIAAREPRWPPRRPSPSFSPVPTENLIRGDAQRRVYSRLTRRRFGSRESCWTPVDEDLRVPRG
jgi:hypothetical protein